MAERRSFEFGPFRLEAKGPLLFRGSMLVPLPPKVAQTLLVLIQNAGQMVSKEELLRTVWPNTFIEEGGLTKTISILRKALDDGSGAEFIATVSKRGYRFTPGVADGVGEQNQSVGLTSVEQSSTPSARRADVANAVVEHNFTLTDRVCRKLNRAEIDPLIIGDHLRYADNGVDSDVLVFFLHGLGLDHSDFEAVLTLLPYRGISPTLYGCEPERRGRISLSLADHVVILRELLRDIALDLQPKIIVLVGFSMGADMGFDLLLEANDGPAIDAFLSLECNLCLDTCTISSVLADVAPEHPEISVADLRRLGESAGSLEQWLNTHEYLVRVLRKFQGDIGVLQRAASDIVRPFRAEEGFQVFARWFHGARDRVRALRLVFPRDSVSTAALASMRLKNLDGSVLSGDFPENWIRISDHADHFQLMSANYVLRQVEEMVTLVRQDAAQGVPRTA